MRTPPVAVCWVSALTALARPKSATLTRPSSAMRTFSGLTSRWISPARWAAASAESDRLEQRERPGRRHRRLLADDVAQGVAGDQLHDQEDGAVLVALVEDRDDVGVGQPGRGAGLAHEAGGELVVVAEPGVHDLDRDGAVEPQVGGLVDAGHAAAGDPGADPVAAVEQPPDEGVASSAAASPAGALDLTARRPPAYRTGKDPVLQSYGRRVAVRAARCRVPGRGVAGLRAAAPEWTSRTS